MLQEKVFHAGKKKKVHKKDLTFSCFSTQDKQTAFLKNKKTI